MLACDTRETWFQFLDYVKNRCSATAYGNWLAPIRVLDSSDETIILEIPNIFVENYLLTNYKKELCLFLPTLPNGEPSIKFIIAPPQKSPAPAPDFVSTLPKESPIKSNSVANFYDVKLNRNYQFSNFIEGSTNQFIYSAAMGVANKPGQSFNPLFIHGGVGLGKTHLLHSIGHHIEENHKQMTVQCITTEGFINELVDNLRNKKVDRMKRFYRSDVSALLIDDIQFLQDRSSFENELCLTLEALFLQGKQIVITSDKPPGELKLSERMVARMEWGLVAQMGIPDLETRVAILHHKAEQKGLKLPSEVAFLIAENIFHNVRQLEGAINRLNAHCRFLNAPITAEMASSILRDMFQQPLKQIVNIEQIFKTVAQVFHVKVSDLKGSCRSQEIAHARQAAMYLAQKLCTKDSLATIGSFFKKTHSTILHGIKTIEKKLQSDPALQTKIDIAERGLTGM